MLCMHAIFIQHTSWRAVHEPVMSLAVFARCCNKTCICAHPILTVNPIQSTLPTTLPHYCTGLCLRQRKFVLAVVLNLQPCLLRRLPSPLLVCVGLLTPLPVPAPCCCLLPVCTCACACVCPLLLPSACVHLPPAPACACLQSPRDPLGPAAGHHPRGTRPGAGCVWHHGAPLVPRHTAAPAEAACQPAAPVPCSQVDRTGWQAAQYDGSCW